MRVARYRAANILERYARKAWVEARNGVTRGLGEAGTREAAGDVEFWLYRVLVVDRGEVESLRDSCVARGDLEHVCTREEGAKSWGGRGGAVLYELRVEPKQADSRGGQ